MADSENLKETPNLEAIILDIQRMSTEDGPGLRTTVFFKGCNLICPWCHNPESIGRKPDLIWFVQKCLGCKLCQKACPQNGISHSKDSLRFNRALCIACGSCASECPNAAIELKGKAMSVEKLAVELAKDKAYFGTDGGITLSGGEAMIQHEAALELAKLLKAADLHIALDTTGHYDFSLLEKMLPFIDIVLYDLKIFDREAHRKFVGTDNRLILENYRLLMEHKVRVWVRTPVIEGATDSEENISAVGAFIVAIGRESKALPERWELCAFNNLCRDKYLRLDQKWAYRDTALTEKAHIETLTKIAAQYVPGTVYTGAVRESDATNLQNSA
jgi:pyruvate formate lyase activating enzyme